MPSGTPTGPGRPPYRLPAPWPTSRPSEAPTRSSHPQEAAAYVAVGIPLGLQPLVGGLPREVGGATWKLLRPHRQKTSLTVPTHSIFDMARLDYDRAASTYDEGRALPLEMFGEWRALLAEFVPADLTGPVLDLGAGTGIWTDALATWLKLAVVGLEPSARMRRQANQASPCPPGHASSLVTHRRSLFTRGRAGPRGFPP